MRIGAPAVSWFESNPEQVGEPASGTRRRLLEPAVVVLLLLLQLPFLPVAFHVDEPNIIALARQIEREPLDPYGFDINWTGTTKPAYEVLANPPVYPAWLALWARLLGWNEISLHASNIPFSVLALMSFMVLARRVGAPPAMAGVLLLGSPAFLLATHVVMPDLAMLSCFLLAIGGSMSFLHHGRRGWLAVVFVAAFLAPLMKYNGILLAPILFVLWFFSGRSKALLIAAAAPAISFALWMALSGLMYGTPHFLALGGLDGGSRSYVISGVMSVLGLGVIPVALAFTRIEYSSALTGWRGSLAVFVLTALMGFFAVGYPARPAVLYGITVAISAHFLILVLLQIGPAMKRQDGITVLLVFWILLVIAFQFKLIFTSVRYLLPLLPAVVLLLLRVGPSGRKASGLFRALAVASVVLSLSVAIGDAAIANVYRRFVRENEVRLRGRSGRLYFAGHWGFQYYAESIGAVQMESYPEPRYVEGDKVVVARNPFPSILVPADRRVSWIRTDIDERVFWPIRTIDCESAANFYGNGIGPCRFQGTASIPFGINFGPADRFSIFEAVKKVPPQRKARR